MKRLTLAAVLIGALSSTCYAEKWVPVSESKDTKTYLWVDLDSIERIGDRRTFWGKTVDQEVMTREDGVQFDQILARYHLDCAADTIYYTSLVVSLKGVRVGHVVNGPTPIRDVLPRSILKTGEIVICS